LGTATRLSLAEVLAPVRDYLDAVEERMRQSAADPESALTAASQQLLASGGKRIRPTIALMAGRIFSADPDRLVAVASAIEMLHTATLVHDDLVDGASLRRGIPTLNARWGPGAAVLTGDYFFARAADLAAQTGSVRVMRVFARALIMLVTGEIEQMFGDRGIVTRAQYFKRILWKTASLFEAACEAAAIVGGANEHEIAAVAAYGRNVGTAFQIVDDVLDFTGDSRHIGKTVGGDLRQGLVTLPTLHYLEMHPDDPDVNALLNGKGGNEGLSSRVVDVIRTSTAIRRSLDDARQFAAEAGAAVSHVPAGPFTDRLRDIAEYVVSRNL
jgi:geranylgeranyl pyrophosphate synthase